MKYAKNNKLSLVDHWILHYEVVSLRNSLAKSIKMNVAKQGIYRLVLPKIR